MLTIFNAKTWAWIVIALAITSTTSFGIGYWTNAKFTESKQVPVLEKALKKTSENIVEAHEKSKEIDQRTTAIANQTSSIKKQVESRFAKHTELKNEKSDDTTVESDKLSCPEFRLDVGTVRLLNAARTGASLDTTGSSNEALNAPTNIGVDKLAVSDVEIAGMYRDLAERHDKLVDAVEQKLKSQAGK